MTSRVLRFRAKSGTYLMTRPAYSPSPIKNSWFGLTHWWISGVQQGVAVTSGRVMLAALPILLGVQLILAFLNYDIQNVPRDVLHKRLLPPHRKSDRS